MGSKLHIRFGLLSAGINFSLMLIQFFAGISLDNPLLKYLPIFILVVCVLSACIMHSKQTGGEATFGELFGIGFRTTAVAIVIFVILFMVFLLVVPAYKERVIQEAMAAGGVEGSAENMALLRDQFMVTALAGTLFLNLIPGLFAAVIGAVIAKKK